MDVERTTETCVSIPLYQSLVSGIAAALCLGVGTLGLQWAIGERVSWLGAAIAGVIAFCAGFALVWVLLLWTMWPRSERPAQTLLVPAQEPREDIPVASVENRMRSIRSFVNASLMRIDGEWVDKDGGCSFREMERKGWSRERWDRDKGWLVAQGLLRWKSEEDHKRGLEWDLDRVSRFMGV